MLDHSRILSLIPHQGRMCLLDRIESFSVDTIACSAVSHLDRDNPLRRDGRLAAICGIEYALQAAASHGALREGSPQRAGYLVSLRGVHVAVAHLDDPAFDRLAIHAEIPLRAPDGLTVAFTLHAGPRLLLRGRASIMIPRAP